MTAATKTDLTLDAWVNEDDVVRLREWGADRCHLLPVEPVAAVTVGSSEACTLALCDPSGRLSRQHARLVRDGTQWIARDLGSKNGMWLDGVRRGEAVLEPGCELGLGGLVLIAESPRRIAVRGFLARLLGWTSTRDRNERSVDLALRALRLAVTRRAALALCGDGDLVPIARGLHRRTLGDRPFVLCDPRRRPGVAPELASGLAAFHAAAGGSVCVWARRLPRDFAELATALRDPASRVQLIVCGQRPVERSDLALAPIEIPPLATRAAEIDRIVDEYADDAAAVLGIGPRADRTRFSALDRAWVRAHSAASLAEIEKGTLRLVALRAAGNVARAAALIGIAHSSLGEWIGRRRLPMQVQQVTTVAMRRCNNGSGADEQPS
jgi:hypothetical protein